MRAATELLNSFYLESAKSRESSTTTASPGAQRKEITPTRTADEKTSRAFQGSLDLVAAEAPVVTASPTRGGSRMQPAHFRGHSQRVAKYHGFRTPKGACFQGLSSRGSSRAHEPLLRALSRSAAGRKLGWALLFPGAKTGVVVWSRVVHEPLKVCLMSLPTKRGMATTNK